MRYIYCFIYIVGRLFLKRSVAPLLKDKAKVTENYDGITLHGDTQFINKTKTVLDSLRSVDIYYYNLLKINLQYIIINNIDKSGLIPEIKLFLAGKDLVYNSSIKWYLANLVYSTMYSAIYCKLLKKHCYVTRKQKNKIIDICIKHQLRIMKKIGYTREMLEGLRVTPEIVSLTGRSALL